MINVIIPTANRPEMLRYALRSVADQTARDKIRSVLVSENGGSLKSREVCEEFSELEINYVFRDPPRTARAHGPLLASEDLPAEYSAILHDDDWWMPDHLENGIRAFRDHPSAVAYYSSFFNVTGESSMLSCDWNFYFWFAAGYPEFKPAWLINRSEVALAALLATPGRYSTLIARTATLRPAMITVGSTKNSYDNDRMLALAMSADGPFLFRPYPGAFIRSHPEQDTHAHSLAARARLQSKTTDWILERCAEAGIDLRPLLARRLRECPQEASILLRGQLSQAYVAPQLRQLASSSADLALLSDILRPASPGACNRSSPLDCGSGRSTLDPPLPLEDKHADGDRFAAHPLSIRYSFYQFAFRLSERLSAVRGRFLRPPIVPADILILTAYTPEISSYGKIATENHAAYARKHGYAFQAITDGFSTERPPAWSKIRFIQRALDTHRWVFWSDADSLVMNEDFPVESLIEPDCDIHLARALAPYPHVNTGGMLFRNSLFSRTFLSAVWRLEVFKNDPTWEQRAINHLLDTYRFSRIRISPNRLFNSFGHVPNDPDPYREGDFIIHFPGVANKEERVNQYSRQSGNSRR